MYNQGLFCFMRDNGIIREKRARSFIMGKVIPFRTREQIERERQEKIRKEWEEFLEFERKHATYLDEENNEPER